MKHALRSTLCSSGLGATERACVDLLRDARRDYWTIPAIDAR